MAKFEDAIDVILNHEGVLSDDKDDPGGITKYGISLRFALAELRKDGDHDGWMDGDFNHDGRVDALDIRTMSEAQARGIYYQYWWKPYGYDKIVNQTVATKVMDCAVNMGWKQAHKLAQRAATGCGHALVDDGALGPISVQAINDCTPRWYLSEFAIQMQTFYIGLVVQKSVLGKYIPGWSRRAMWPFIH